MSLKWKIEYRPEVSKDLKNLDKVTRNRIIKWLEDRLLSAASDPHTSGIKLKGDKLGGLWRYRVGNYRVLCIIEDHKLLIIVVEIGHRRNVYQ